MSNETRILTDLEMTRFIWDNTKGDGAHKQKVKEDWLDFSLATYAETENSNPLQFLMKINKWLKQHKIPIIVQDFNLLDESIGGTDWIVLELLDISN
jgi:hypothetical protein